MSIVKAMAGVVASLALMSAAPSFAADGGEFNGSSFTCLEFTNGLGENASGKMQSTLARLWFTGYLAGYYKAQGTLELSAEPADSEALDNILLQTCRTYPQSNLLAVAVSDLIKMPRKV